MNSLRSGSLLVIVLCLTGRCVAQSAGSAEAKPAPGPATVTLLMDWTRGDRYYGFHFIELRAPCQVPSEQKCECKMEFKEMSSKDNAAEFADYVSSFEHKKIPVTFKLSYTADGVFSGALMQGVGSWTRDAFPMNDTLLGLAITIRRSSPGQVQRAKTTYPADCFPSSVSGRVTELPKSTPKSP
jgi:hypothetical protein